MKRAVLVCSIFFVLVLLLGCTQVQQPQQPSDQQGEQQPEQTTSEAQPLANEKPVIKAAKNATAFVNEMTASLDCKRKSEMEDLLAESKEKLNDNDARLIDAEDDLKEVKAGGNVANIAVKKKVVDIVKKNEVILKDRIAKLEAFLARC